MISILIANWKDNVAALQVYQSTLFRHTVFPTSPKCSLQYLHSVAIIKPPGVVAVGVEGLVTGFIVVVVVVVGQFSSSSPSLQSRVPSQTTRLNKMLDDQTCCEKYILLWATFANRVKYSKISFLTWEHNCRHCRSDDLVGKWVSGSQTRRWNVKFFVCVLDTVL